MSQKVKQKGFTLLEVIIAMAIVSVAVVSVVQAASAYTKNTAYMRDKVLAHWVANNLMTEYLLTTDKPLKGSKSGTEEMAGTEWQWTRELSETPTPEMLKVSISVRRGESEGALASLSSFVGSLIKPCVPQQGASQPQAGAFGGSNNQTPSGGTQGGC